MNEIEQELRIAKFTARNFGLFSDNMVNFFEAASIVKPNNQQLKDFFPIIKKYHFFYYELLKLSKNILTKYNINLKDHIKIPTSRPYNNHILKKVYRFVGLCEDRTKILARLKKNNSARTLKSIQKKLDENKLLLKNFDFSIKSVSFNLTTACSNLVSIDFYNLNLLCDVASQIKNYKLLLNSFHHL